MCLLILCSRVHPELPLVVAANRDERMDRPADPMAVLSDSHPRVLGGRDRLAGGTWLAVNELGVVAGLTNAPLDGGTRDPAKRTRGELPIALASHETAATAVDAFATAFRPDDYNPSWLLVADRVDAYCVDMTHGGAPEITSLPAGIHVVENRAPGSETPKVIHVRGLLGDVATRSPAALVDHLGRVLADHDVPPAPEDGDDGMPAIVRAACVHGGEYGTRWSAILTVDANPPSRPRLLYHDGHACESPYLDAARLW